MMLMLLLGDPTARSQAARYRSCGGKEEGGRKLYGILVLREVLCKCRGMIHRRGQGAGRRPGERDRIGNRGRNGVENGDEEDVPPGYTQQGVGDVLFVLLLRLAEQNPQYHSALPSEDSDHSYTNK